MYLAENVTLAHIVKWAERVFIFTKDQFAKL